MNGFDRVAPSGNVMIDGFRSGPREQTLCECDINCDLDCECECHRSGV